MADAASNIRRVRRIPWGLLAPRLKYTAEITGIPWVRRIGIPRAIRCDSENPRPTNGPNENGRVAADCKLLLQQTREQNTLGSQWFNGDGSKQREGEI